MDINMDLMEQNIIQSNGNPSQFDVTSWVSFQ